KILDIQAELVSGSTDSAGQPTLFRISTQVSDELDDRGIKEVVLEWRDVVKREWVTVTLIRDTSRGKGWYTVAEPLPLPSNGAAIQYDIIVTDIDNQSVASGLREYRPFVLPDARLVTIRGRLGFSDGLIYYGYAHEEGAWTINADIEQVEDIELKQNLEVAFFEGNPDRDGDQVIDAGAKLLGRTQIRPNAWQRRNPLEPHKTSLKENFGKDSLLRPRTFQENPLNTNWISTATLPYELSMGTYEIFVYIDPVFDFAPTSYGKLREGDEEDNIQSRLIQVQSALIGKADKRVFSQDAIIDFRIPARAVPQLPNAVSQNGPAVLTIVPLNNQQQPKPEHQPSLIPITLPNGSGSLAYSATLDNAPSGQNTELNQPITAEIRFDLPALQEAVRDELGLAEIGDLLPDQTDAINEGAEQQAKEIGIYLWVEALRKWVRLDSELVMSPNGSMATQSALANLRDSNFGDGELNTIKFDDAGVRLGKWVLLFTSSQTYRVLIREGLEEASPLQVIDPNRTVDRFEDAPSDFRDGVAIGIKSGEIPFQFGDVMTFTILQSAVDPEAAPGEDASGFYTSGMRERNTGSGILQYVRLEENSRISPDRWVILFIDSERFQVEGERSGLLSRNGQPIIGRIGEEYVYSEFSLRLKITVGDRDFEAGDSFRFETKEVGRIRADVPMLGTLALMRSTDTVPPDLQLTIGKQNFIDGDHASSEPLIQATLTDDNGIDYITRPIHLEISRDNREFTLIPETDYRLSHRPGSNQVILNYQSPELEPGTYQARLTASDLDGNESQQEIEFRIARFLQLLSAMNYPNPFTEDTEITCELTGAGEEMTIKIYSLSGRLIRQFTEPAPAGFMMMSWDGRDKDGEEVANGVYYCKIRVRMPGEKDLTEYIKMMKLK
ncbi:MAG: T9SS type A sorting domain-containing protein, partial [Candidatus Poribacteria bacterium]|nr:T9SS type A sorting domain-containing protein [Candidatus Poribacteria bacterium]